MKAYKKMSLLIIIAFLSTNIALAQGRQQGPPPVPNDEQIEKMIIDLSKELSLSEAQEEKVSEVYFNHFEEVSELQEKNKDSRAGNREAMQKLKTNFEKEVKALLTKDQQKLYETYLKGQESKRGKRERPQGRNN